MLESSGGCLLGSPGVLINALAGPSLILGSPIYYSSSVRVLWSRSLRLFSSVYLF
jgi:hypothetical protein